MTTGDIPSGRVGRYVCPFCQEVMTVEAQMIEHRSSGECAAKRDALRVGALR